MESIYCSNKDCRWHGERKGGRFYYRSGMPYCDECVHAVYPGQPGKDLWQFETFNIAGEANSKPIQVQSLRHLRQLEKQHGVISVAANFSEKNWNEAPRGSR
jgi:hypothetical protein